MLCSAILIEPIRLRPLSFNSINPNKSNNFTTTITSRRFHSPKPPRTSLSGPRLEGHFWVVQTTNVVIGGTFTDDSNKEWLALDHKVNSHPTVRGFTAIAIGAEDFVQSMVVAVESVIQQPIPKGCVKQKLSSGGKYVSVNIGPIQVVSSEQVQAVYNAMRRDDRVKYFL